MIVGRILFLSALASGGLAPLPASAATDEICADYDGSGTVDHDDFDLFVSGFRDPPRRRRVQVRDRSRRRRPGRLRRLLSLCIGLHRGRGRPGRAAGNEHRLVRRLCGVGRRARREVPGRPRRGDLRMGSFRLCAEDVPEPLPDLRRDGLAGQARGTGGPHSEGPLGRAALRDLRSALRGRLQGLGTGALHPVRARVHRVVQRRRVDHQPHRGLRGAGVAGSDSAPGLQGQGG